MARSSQDVRGKGSRTHYLVPVIHLEDVVGPTDTHSRQGWFRRTDTVRVLLDEGVDEIEVLDQGVPDLEPIVGRKGDAGLLRLNRRLDDLEPLVDEERWCLVQLVLTRQKRKSYRSRFW
jgi:hypothetical protein